MKFVLYLPIEYKPDIYLFFSSMLNYSNGWFYNIIFHKKPTITKLNKYILFALTFSFFVCTLEAQLEMNSSGEVGIGSSPISGIDFYTPEAKIVNLGVGQSPSSSYKLLVNGVARFQASTVAGFEFSAYDTWEMKMLPSFNNMCRIGSSTKSFYQVYTRYLYVNGSQVTSDLRTKENIRDLSHSLEKLVSVRGVKFDFITPDESEISPATKEEMEYLDKDRMGFIAQELMVVFPELVKYNEEADRLLIGTRQMILTD